MYWVNKIIWFWASPVAISVLTMIVGFVIVVKANQSGRWRRIGKGLVILPTLAIWLMATPIVNQAMQGITERRYEKIDAAEAPCGDVILSLSGSWCRGWFAAEMLKAGKAPLMIITGIDVMKIDVPLIYDLGVDKTKVVIDNEARNTEENITNARRLYLERLNADSQLAVESGSRLSSNPKVLLVTSVYHMPRSELMMRKYWPEAEVVPVPTEFMVKDMPFNWRHLLPSVESICYFNAAFHEWVGYLWYRWCR